MELTQTTHFAQQAIQLGRARRWWWRVAGVRPYPLAPVYRDGFWLVPTSDVSALPKMARERIAAIRAAQIPVRGIVVAHEATRRLPGARPRPSKGARRTIQSAALAALGLALAALAYASGLTLLLGLTLLVDPVVYVVLDDGEEQQSWIEVVRWYEDL